MEWNEAAAQHLYWRAGFGARPAQLQAAVQLGQEGTLDLLFKQGARYRALDGDVEMPSVWQLRNMTAEDRQEVVRAAIERQRKLNVAWLLKLATGKQCLREKMTLFWHDHFACVMHQPAWALQLNNTIRKNALGNFKDLLVEVAQTPAMLRFLNNQQNRKDHPNENFARELLELFTLGRGHYTEQDVKEAARAFTGWQIGHNGTFRFNEWQHDNGHKTFMGQQGYFTGLDIIDIVLANRQTALHITEKLYRYLVNEQQVDQALLKRWATDFYDSGYNIEALVRQMLSSPHFYAPQNRGCNVKSPVALLAGLMYQFEVGIETPATLLKVQQALGQVLFYPPNVAGWPSGMQWIDSSTLMLRMRLPSLLLNGGVIDAEAYGMEVARVQARTRQRFDARANWRGWQKAAGAMGSTQALKGLLLTAPLSPVAQKVWQEKQGASLQKAALALVSLPEYQMC